MSDQTIYLTTAELDLLLAWANVVDGERGLDAEDQDLADRLAAERDRREWK